MPITEPLTRGYQLFLQRLMAVHVLNDDDAIKLHEELNDTRSKSLEQSLGIMNQQLSTGFGLEVATVNLDGMRYHAIVNSDAEDAIAQASFSLVFTPHERAYIRMVLEKLCEDETAPRMDLVNLRTNLKDPYKPIAIDAAEHVLDSLLEEHWLIFAKNIDRRKSMSAEYQLGPRTYLELSSLLTDFGMPADELPQMFFHRT